jgi:pimeloyl-ACP methyl ester carboxylesterase
MPYVRTRLGRLFYDEHGEARRPGDPPILLLHGLLFDGAMWRGQIEALSALGRVIVMDGPGHGKSESAPRFTIEEHAEALGDALAALEIPSVLVVGLSWGGMVGMRLALQHPARVAGLALLDTSAEREGFVQRLRYRGFIAMHRRFGIPYRFFVTKMAPLMFAPRTLLERPDLLEASYRRMAGFDREGICEASLAVVVHRSSIADQLGRIRVPTLVMCGREDRATPPGRSETIARVVPGARLVVLEGLGHMSTLEDPVAVNQHLVPFVRTVVGG